MSMKLGYIRSQMGLTQKEMAHFLDTPLATYRNWEYEYRSMTLGKAIEISKKLDISIDYLCGLTDKKNSVIEEMRFLPDEAVDEVYAFIEFKKGLYGRNGQTFS